MSGHLRSACAIVVAHLAVVLAAAPADAAAPLPPKPIPLREGWEIRDVLAPPAPAQPKPPEEGQPDAVAGQAALLPAQRSQATSEWRPVKVPSVFYPQARAAQFSGTVKSYRLSFRAPNVEGFDWAFAFEQARRRATVFLNGRRIGISIDPYTPFRVPARGLLPGKLNTLEVTVDSRKDPRVPEGWWNWGGITRPVTLVPVGRAHVRDLGLMSRVSCSGPATGCAAAVLVDGVLSSSACSPLTKVNPLNSSS